MQACNQGNTVCSEVDYGIGLSMYVCIDTPAYVHVFYMIFNTFYVFDIAICGIFPFYSTLHE